MFKNLFRKKTTSKETIENKVVTESPVEKEKTLPPRGHNQEISDKTTEMIKISGIYVNTNWQNIIGNIYSKMENENDTSEIYKAVLKGVNEAIDTVERNCNMCSSCGKGCAACCYQAIYVNSIEAELILRELKKHNKNELRYIKKQAIHILNSIRETNIHISLTEDDDRIEEKNNNLEFLELNLRCPLLSENNECMIYETRPLACFTYRNYGNPADCQGDIAPHVYDFPEYKNIVSAIIERIIEIENMNVDSLYDYVLLAKYLADKL